MFLSLQTAYSNAHSPKPYIRKNQKIDLTFEIK